MNNPDDNVIEVPIERLSAEALNGILEEYCTRGGYELDMPLESRKKSVMRQLRQGDLKIYFDTVEGSVNISRPQ